MRGRLRQLPALSTARGPPPAGTRNCTGSRAGRTAALSVVGLPIPSFIAAQGGVEGASPAPAGSEHGAERPLMQIR